MNYFSERTKFARWEIDRCEPQCSFREKTHLSSSAFLLASIIAAITLVVPATSVAQDKTAPPQGTETITVDVRTPFSPSKFEGLVISPDGVITEKVNPTVEEVAPNFYTVTFPVDRKTEGSSMASAVAFAGDDGISVGTVMSIQSSNEKNSCVNQDPDPVTLEIDAGTIRALCANRLKRRDHNRKIFELSFNQFPRRDIEIVERNFGLHSNEKPGEELNPFRMIERISRLISALDGWNFRKSSVLPSSTSVNENTSSAEGRGDVFESEGSASARLGGEGNVSPSSPKIAGEP